MKKITYTFDEFRDHIHAMQYVRDYDCVTRGTEEVEIGSDKCFELYVLRIMDYMGQIYPDQEERMQKGSLLSVMMSYMAEHMQDFDKAHHAYDSGNPDEPSFLSEALLRAIHRVFTSRPLSELGHGPTPQEIIALADRFKEEEKPSTNHPNILGARGGHLDAQC